MVIVMVNIGELSWIDLMVDGKRWLIIGFLTGGEFMGLMCWLSMVIWWFSNDGHALLVN